MAFSDSSLSEREIQVVQCAADGKDTDETAQELDLSAATIKTHRARLLKKLKCRNIAHAVGVCFRAEIIK